MSDQSHILRNLQTVLQAAAERLGSLDAVADQVQVQVSVLEGLQRGDVGSFTTSASEALAGVVGLDPTAIWSPEPLDTALSFGFFRGAWPDFDHRDVPVFRAAVERGASLRALRAVLGLEDSARVLFQTREPVPPPYVDGLDRARQVRQALGLSAKPLPNLHRLLPEQLDIAVLHGKLKTTRLTAAAIRTSFGEAIVLNDRVESKRVFQRRSLAHELAHVLFDSSLLTVDQALDGQPDDSPAEQRARAFAAEFLVPVEGLVEMLGSAQRDADPDRGERMAWQVAVAFGAPTELVVNHLDHRGYIAKSIRSALIQRLRRRSVRVARERRFDVLEQRLRAAVEQDLITPGRAAEIREAAAA